jgi:uroporphyrinogen III methyltransferase/synthase
LITVRGAEVLRKADCVIYDKLANPALLKYARSDAEIIAVPKRIGKGSTTQEQINNLLVEKTAGGRTVVRLKGGDPCIFGRVAEELVVLIEAGIDFEIVPGITAGVAVSSYAGIMLTDRQYSSQVLFITGHEAEGKQDSNIDWPLLAKFGGTIVFYMGVGNLDLIAGRLIENGKPKDTPVALIANVTFPTQRIVRATLGDIEDKRKQSGLEPPAIIVIGEAAGSDAGFNWFGKMFLFGKTIVVTRDDAGNADFAAKIIERGGNPVEFPTLKIRPLTQSNEFLRTLAKLAQYDWIIFTSANGVTIFFEAISNLGKDARVFGSVKIAAIGERTTARLGEFGIKADFLPTVFTGEQLGIQLSGFANLRDKKILLLRSQLASNELVDLLAKAGAEIENVAIYTAEMNKGDSALLTEQIEQGKIDWLTFASPSSVDGFFEQIAPEKIQSSKIKVASVGPVTSERLRQHGIGIDIEATEHTIDGLIDAIEQFCK